MDPTLTSGINCYLIPFRRLKFLIVNPKVTYCLASLSFLPTKASSLTTRFQSEPNINHTSSSINVRSCQARSCSGALEPERVLCPFHLKSSPARGADSGLGGLPIQVLRGYRFRSRGVPIQVQGGADSGPRAPIRPRTCPI